MYPSGCHDCDSLTGGRCWRHAQTVIIYVPVVSAPTVIIKPPPSTLIPILPDGFITDTGLL